MWKADYGPEGILVWNGYEAEGWGRAWRSFTAFDDQTTPGKYVGIGGGYPRFPWGDDRETDLMVFIGKYLPASSDVRVAFSGDFQEVKDRVVPGTPEGAVR